MGALSDESYRFKLVCQILDLLDRRLFLILSLSQSSGSTRLQVAVLTATFLGGLQNTTPTSLFSPETAIFARGNLVFTSLVRRTLLSPSSDFLSLASGFETNPIFTGSYVYAACLSRSV